MGVVYSPHRKGGNDKVDQFERTGVFMRSESSFASPTPRDNNDTTIAALVLREHIKMCSTLTEWRDQQRNMHAAQERLMDRILRDHSETMEELRRVGLDDSRGSQLASPWDTPLHPASPGPWDRVGTPGRVMQGFVHAEVMGEDPSLPLLSNPAEGTHADHTETRQSQGAAPRTMGGDPQRETDFARKIAAQLEALGRDEHLLDHWRRSSGLHTVEDWVLNYREHPGGWAALLMIHGISEFTGRLRSKVENYAIYSALFLSMSVALLADPPDHIADECPGDSAWGCHIRKRAYFHGLAVGTAAHMLCISLGMAFVNALNETARDSDIYRLFSRGQGLRATQKCQVAFAVGCVADFVAVAVTTSFVVSWVETLVCVTSLALVALVIFQGTASRLVSSCSITGYWREERGGCPDPNDPYDLQIPAQCFQERARLNKALFMEGGALQGGASQNERQSTLWNDLREKMHERHDSKGPSNDHPQTHELQIRKIKRAVAMGAMGRH